MARTLKQAGVVVTGAMYPVTHMTIAVGSVWLGEKLSRRFRHATGQASTIDYRFAALGSQIPDLIDKPLKYYIFPGSLPDSHVYGHTLLLPVCIILIGLLLARRGDLRLLVLGLGCLTHPLVDPGQYVPAHAVLAALRHRVPGLAPGLPRLLSDPARHRADRDVRDPHLAKRALA